MLNGLLYQFGTSVRLHFRNRMALLYSYLFPTIFLLAFWALYRYEAVPLVRHMGELLTVTALGGACFGLPTALVSERERGVWRRFRLTPVSTLSLVGSTLLSRYLLLVSAGAVQLALAMSIFGMPAPAHPLDLLLAFTFVCFAFLGLGLIIAMLADNVPAVQALGQCIFLPMLIIGGVAVRLEALPSWAQHLSAYFPGRYAVEAIQACVTGAGLQNSRFALLALLLIGAAGLLAGAKLFRWDQQQRFTHLHGKAWVGVALAGWVAVGVLAQLSGQVSPREPVASDGESLRGVLQTRAARDGAAAASPELGDEVENAAVGTNPETAQNTVEPTVVEMAEAVDSAPAAPEAPATPPEQPWQAVTTDEIEEVDFAALPPDQGVVAPVGSLDDTVLPENVSLLQCMRTLLPDWAPAMAADPVQRTRNVLYVAAVPDLFQMEDLERAVPVVVFEHLQATTPRDDLTKILYWIATHPEEGTDDAVDRLRGVCMDVAGPSDVATLRERTRFYALKLLGRLRGAIPS